MLNVERIATSDIHPVEAQMSPNDLSDGWQRGLSVNGLGCTHRVLVDDAYTTAIRVSTPDGMPGPEAYEDWMNTPMPVHIYTLVRGNEMESQMAFDRWVVEYAHEEMRAECR